jgi:hypothetical protein
MRLAVRAVALIREFAAELLGVYQLLTNMFARAESTSTMYVRPSSAEASSAIERPSFLLQLVQIYQLVAARRSVFDSLLWTAPSVSFSAHSYVS